MNIVNLSTGDYVYVSVASRSKVAGKLVEVLSVSDPVFGRNEVKVRDADGNIGYVSSQFIEPEESAFKWKLCSSVLVVKDHKFTIAAATDGTPMWTTHTSSRASSSSSTARLTTMWILPPRSRLSTSL